MSVQVYFSQKFNTGLIATELVWKNVLKMLHVCKHPKIKSGGIIDGVKVRFSVWVTVIIVE